jgi:hypothetical protein
VSSLAGGIGGQTAMLKKLAVHLSVPGDSYVVGEDPTGVGDPARFDWKVLSSSELQVARRDPLTYRVMEYEGRWRTLQGEYFVCRVWNPDDEFSWRASSSVMSALPIMREVDYWNRYIIAILLSRLAMNGMLLVPSEVTFPPSRADETRHGAELAGRGPHRHGQGQPLGTVAARREWD